MPNSLGIPEWEQLGIPEVDEAEPEDAGRGHVHLLYNDTTEEE